MEEEKEEKVEEEEEKEGTSKELDVLLRKIKDLESTIEKLKERTAEREEKERFLEEMRRFLNAIQGENVINIRISTTARSAMYRLKRGVWALFSRLKKEKPNFDLDKSKENWANIASKIIEETNKKGLTDHPTKIILLYDLVEEDGKLVFKPKEARLLYFEPAGHLTIEYGEGGS